jgi:probable F420-dependent oxidoreductase
MVVLESEPTRARDIARKNIARYLLQTNYRNSLIRTGFTEADFGNDSTPPTDRLVDAIVAWGDEDAIVARVREHESAGADHVALQVLTATPREMPHAEWQRLADALL